MSDLSNIDYAILMKETLNKLHDSIIKLDACVIACPDLITLTETALDYLYYLEDTSAPTQTITERK